MEIQITSRHAKTSESLRETITEEIDKLTKFHDTITSCHVILDSESLVQSVEIVAHIQNHTIRALGKAEKMGKALDSALAKVERQLKKINEKIKSHKPPKAVDRD